MRISTEHIHHAWDNSLEPVLEISSGETVELELADASGAQLSSTSNSSDVISLDLSRVNPVTGPIRVVGTKPGDALVVSIRELEVAEWGWSALIPGFGLLADDFPDPELVHVRTLADVVELPFGPRLPSRPMIGTIGVARPEPGPHPLLPPSRFGGNMDIRHVTAGATLYLPVGVDGALLSLGDAHATMGDGECAALGSRRPAMRSSTSAFSPARPSPPRCWRRPRLRNGSDRPWRPPESGRT
jgi:acetamidase/formamidase